MRAEARSSERPTRPATRGHGPCRPGPEPVEPGHRQGDKAFRPGQGACPGLHSASAEPPPQLGRQPSKEDGYRRRSSQGEAAGWLSAHAPHARQRNQPELLRKQACASDTPTRVAGPESTELSKWTRRAHCTVLIGPPPGAVLAVRVGPPGPSGAHGCDVGPGCSAGSGRARDSLWRASRSRIARISSRTRARRRSGTRRRSASRAASSVMEKSPACRQACHARSLVSVPRYG